MDSKPSKSTSDPSSTTAATTTTHRPPSPLAPPSYSDHPTTQLRRPSTRPGEDLLQSGDPSTAELRAWAADKQMHVPGTDGSFVTGPMSGGVGAVSGGPVFLPRKEYNVEPPMTSVDIGRVEVGEKKEKEKKERRGSLRDFFRRMKGGKEREEGEEEKGKGGEGEVVR